MNNVRNGARPSARVRRRRTAVVSLLLGALVVIGLPLVGFAHALSTNEPAAGRSVGAPSGLGDGDLPTEGELSADDGYIPDAAGISPFDDHPAVQRLRPVLRDAVQQAATDALEDGIELRITDGWRSPRYQAVLLDQAIIEYGSEAEARRYVNPPGESTHNTGDAVDIGPTDAADWVIRHGDRYGLCQTYANEMWHFELTVAPGETCPQPLPDAAS